MQIDIGVMPLQDSEWAKGKCGFKALQFHALEIPVIASPVGVNSNIIRHGINGFLCKTQDDWYNSILELINDAILRKQMGKAGRNQVIDQFSARSNTANFLSLFE